MSMNLLYHVEETKEWLRDVMTTRGAALAQTMMDDDVHNSTSTSSSFCSSGMMGGGMVSKNEVSRSRKTIMVMRH